MGEKKCPPPGLPGWMGTYGDMMTLLLCFFVLLFAMSTTDTKKFQTLMEAFKGSFGVIKGGKTVSPETLITNTKIEAKGTELKFQTLKRQIMQEIDRMKKNKNIEAIEGLKENANIRITERGLEISLGDSTLFDSGEADLKENAKQIIKAIYSKLRGLDNQIIIEGHTDNIPINTKKFPSNWELSSARSISVLKNLLELDPKLREKVSVAGYADTKATATNDTVEGRKKNRRVNIVILRSMEERVNEKIDERASEVIERAKEKLKTIEGGKK